MSKKYFKFTKDYIIKGEICFKQNDELTIDCRDNIEYVLDGCLKIFKADCETAKEYGEFIYRPW